MTQQSVTTASYAPPMAPSEAPARPDLAQPSLTSAPEIKALEVARDTETPAQPSQEPEILLKRRRRRRLDLKSIAGTLRESARVYRELAEGRISAGVAEVRSRVLRRHGDLLSAAEQQRQLEDIQSQLVALQQPQGPRLLNHEQREIPEWMKDAQAEGRK